MLYWRDPWYGVCAAVLTHNACSTGNPLVRTRIAQSVQGRAAAPVGARDFPLLRVQTGTGADADSYPMSNEDFLRG
jgi:hypothetical protein